MMLAPMAADQNFDPQIAHQMFMNPEGRDLLIDNIIRNMQEKGYVGLDIDFEYILPEDKDLFIEFIAETERRLNEAGFFTMAALAPKVSGEMVGLLYEAHDYPAIGAIVDYALLMTYEWGYLLDLQWQLPHTECPTSIRIWCICNSLRKFSWASPTIHMTGLSFIQGESQAEALSNQEAVLRASQVGTTIEFDEESQSPFYTYTDVINIDMLYGLMMLEAWIQN